MIALENEQGYPVGHCSECRFIQTKLYFLQSKEGYEKEGYCLTCFPKIVDLKIAEKRAKELLEIK